MLGILSLLLTAVSFSSPVHYDIALAGNFGEPRPNHFHGGIDIKTEQREGKAIYSIAAGYVSRVSVGLYGFGKAVYVQHPSGQTSVYCHLKSFSPRIEQAVKRWQYEHKTWAADVRLKPTDVPVAEGSFIAFSGNTGASEAPHLHLEIHDTKTWNMRDPLDFLGKYVVDGMKPIAHGFMAYPVEGEGSFCGGSMKQSFAFTAHHLTRQFTAWGKVGFGIWANDYMEATYNRYGIRQTKLLVDGKVVFESVVDNIPVSHHRMVNSWGDYYHYLRSNVWYMKSFVEPGNALPILHIGDDRGIVCFDEERDYRIEYVLSDFKNNTQTYSFTVRGQKTAIRPRRNKSVLLTLRYDRMNYFPLGGAVLSVRQGLLPDNVELQPRIRRQPDKLSDSYQFYSTTYPLFNWAKIHIRLNRTVKDPSKVYVKSNWGSNTYMGGTYKDGWVTGRCRELGATYELDIDENAPRITPVNQSEWISRHRICIGLTENESGLKRYEAYLDGQFILFSGIEKTSWVACNLADTPVKKTGEMRTLKFIAEDNRNNRREFTAQVKW